LLAKNSCNHIVRAGPKAVGGGDHKDEVIRIGGIYSNFFSGWGRARAAGGPKTRAGGIGPGFAAPRKSRRGADQGGRRGRAKAKHWVRALWLGAHEGPWNGAHFGLGWGNLPGKRIRKKTVGFKRLGEGGRCFRNLFTRGAHGRVTHLAAIVRQWWIRRREPGGGARWAFGVEGEAPFL